MKDYGIQLYSVRDAMQEDVRGTLRKIADMGYKYVEFAGFFGHSAEEIRQFLDDTGLVISGTHSSWEDLRPSKIMETVAYHKTIGNPDYIVPGADLSTLEKIEDFCNVMNFAQPILAAEGIKCRIVSMHTIKPIDKDAIIDAANNTGGIVTIEEHNIIGGLGAAVAEVIADKGLCPKAFKRLAFPDVNVAKIGGQKWIRDQYGLQARGIADSVRAALKK